MLKSPPPPKKVNPLTHNRISEKMGHKQTNGRVIQNYLQCLRVSVLCTTCFTCHCCRKGLFSIGRKYSSFSNQPALEN